MAKNNLQARMFETTDSLPMMQGLAVKEILKGRAYKGARLVGAGMVQTCTFLAPIEDHTYRLYIETQMANGVVLRTVWRDTGMHLYCEAYKNAHEGWRLTKLAKLERRGKKVILVPKPV